MFRLAPPVVAAVLVLSAGGVGVARAQVIIHGVGNSQPPPSNAPSVAKPDQDYPDLSKAGPLQDATRLTLVRYIDGELVHVLEPLPTGKDGFRIKAGGPIDEDALHMALASHGSALNSGDQAQITDLQFKDKEIVIELNGGGTGHTKLRDRIHMEVGGAPQVTTTDPDNTPVATALGATLHLDFNRPLPEMTPKELKQLLGGVLNFSRHSAALQWMDDLPPEIQKAIEEKRATVGMDQDMVLAAIGRPDHKVRERDVDGTETEDWIYGNPPERTVFVVFEGDKVTKVERFPN